MRCITVFLLCIGVVLATLFVPNVVAQTTSNNELKIDHKFIEIRKNTPTDFEFVIDIKLNESRTITSTSQFNNIFTQVSGRREPYRLEYYILTNITYNKTTWIPIIKCMCSNNVVNISGSYCLSETCQDKGRNITQEITEERKSYFAPLNQNIRPNEWMTFLIHAKKKPELGDVNIDIIPQMFGIYLRDYLWWNTSYSNKMPLNITYNNTNYPCMINYTYGFEINDSNDTQYVWTMCGNDDNDTYLYYNSTTDYLMINETANSIMSTDVEVGNGTSNAPLSIWSAVDDLYIRYDMEDGEDSLNNKNGTFLNAPTKISCYFANCYTFDGVNQALETNWIPDTGQSNSFSMWLKIPDLTTTHTSYVFGEQSGSTYTSYNMYYLNATDGGPKFGFNMWGQTATFTLNASHNNTWIHVVGVGNYSGVGSTIKIYVNGVLGGTSGGFSGQTSATSTVLIGVLNTSGSPLVTHYTKAQYDEIRFYTNHALTLNEINMLYKEGQRGLLGADEGYTPPPSNYSYENWTYPNITYIVQIDLTDKIYNATCVDSTHLLEVRNVSFSNDAFADIIYCPNGCIEEGGEHGAMCKPMEINIIIFMILLVIVVGIVFIRVFKRRR